MTRNNGGNAVWLMAVDDGNKRVNGQTQYLRADLVDVWVVPCSFCNANALCLATMGNRLSSNRNDVHSSHDMMDWKLRLPKGFDNRRGETANILDDLMVGFAQFKMAIHTDFFSFAIAGHVDYDS